MTKVDCSEDLSMIQSYQLALEPVQAFDSARVQFISAGRMEGWRATVSVKLPDTAAFFMRNRESLVSSEFGPDVRAQVSCFDGDLNSQGLVILGDTQSHIYVLIGALSAERSLTYFSVHVRQKRLNRVSIWQPDVKAEADVEPIIVLEGNDWRELLKAYAERTREYAKMEPLAVESASRLGYCSWYYTYQNVTESEFTESLAVLREHKEAFPVKYAQIDDGYQSHHGDWLVTNQNWPSSLEQVAGKISGTGFVPGIWAMPLLATTTSELFKEHPDWFIQDPHAEGALIIPGWSPPPEERWVCLDGSHPGAQGYLKHVFSTLYRWGYRYFKLDGLGLSYPDGRRHDPHSTGISCLRECLRIIREATADSIILSCGGPLLPCLGLAEHARISGDTGKFWKAEGVPGLAGLRAMDDWETQDPAMPSLSNALQQSLQSWWRYDRWFRADPDVVMLRDENTNLTEGEARMSGLVAMMTGVVFTSDRLDRMGQERIDLLARVSALRLHDMEPLHLEQRGPLSLFIGRQGQRKALAIFNWSSSSVTYDLANSGLFAGSVQEVLQPWGHLSDLCEIPKRDAILLVELECEPEF
ncbi:alpha-galactosidase [Coraliomargarita sp. SDUM461004]|uniref:Alpha-galactosidase n=1 Tax=Thalassobacterium sedimentorum TaxID=3041258 RepID=A0ABU1AJJ0_9BACT|nr:alpha-galactosidase [Coraliomargarita sp. SDUM461004]MDQ8194809.1 alpha-galactosidase [Coraliomargarita sp. SDUM461004]